jgi:hypothetical protein
MNPCGFFCWARWQLSFYRDEFRAWGDLPYGTSLFKCTGFAVSTAVTQLALWPSGGAAIAEPTGVVSKDVMTPALQRVA